MSLNILTSESVAKHIETLVTVKRLSYLDAVLYFCETRKIDPTDIAPYLSDKIKTHLIDDGQNLHLLRREMTLF